VLGKVLVGAVLGGAAVWMLRRGPKPSGPPIARCPVHGVAYDADLEVCPECSKS
jgi:hypothetical protein